MAIKLKSCEECKHWKLVEKKGNTSSSISGNCALKGIAKIYAYSAESCNKAERRY